MLGALSAKTLVSLQAGTDLTVSNPVVVTDSDITLQSGHSLTIASPLTASGLIYLKANTANDPANAGSFQINAPVSGGTVYLSTTSPLGIGINQTVTSTASSPLITVACDCFIQSSLPVVLQAPGGTIEYRPATNGFNQTMLTHDESVFNAGLLRFGLSHDPLIGSQALAGSLVVGSAAGAISLDGHSLDLRASGNIGETQGAFFTNVGTLTGAGGSASFNGEFNDITSLGPFTTSAGDLSLTAAGPLNVAGAINATGNVTMQTPTVLAVQAPIASGGAVQLSAGQILGILADVTAPGDIRSYRQRQQPTRRWTPPACW